MKLIKPSWVYHEDGKDKGRRTPIYSLHIHPDGSRLATAGLDAKIRIWSTLPILDEAVEANEANPKLLCTMAQHDGSVLCVRWAHHGRYLASGSDDNVVVIWDLDPRGGGRVFGSADVNVETWKPLQRLVGHSSDVVDIAWNRDDTMLATVGLDSTVFVWDATTFHMITKITQHEGFVKGVCWDPVGEYLATQSDDKSVKIWRTTDWGLEKTVTEPFFNSPASTFFRRLSWSPDGAFIASSNAMNSQAFTAAIIQRFEWKQDISFVGHENTVEVTAFNPRIFLPEGSKPSRGKVSSMVALGSDDRSISIWLNVLKAPKLIVKEVFDGNIFDLCWTDQGRTLYACSSDGSIACLDFSDEEITGFAADGVLDTILNTYTFYKSRPQMAPPRANVALPPAPTLTVHQLRAKSALTPFNSNPIVGSEPVPVPEPTPQNITVTRTGKKRIQPSFMGGGSGLLAVQQQPQQPVLSPTLVVSPAALPSSSGAAANDVFSPRIMQDAQAGPSSARFPPSFGGGSVLQQQHTREDSLMSDGQRGTHSRQSTHERGDVEMGPASPPAWAGGAQSTSALGKRKVSGEDDDDEQDGDEGVRAASSSKIKARTLGGGVKRLAVVDKEIRPAGAVALGPGGRQDASVPVLPLLGVRSFLKAVAEESNGSDWVEARNDPAGGPTEIAHLASSQVQWLDFLPSPVVALVLTALFSAFACEDGTLAVYSPTGRKLFPSLRLDGPAAILKGNNKGSLSVVTCFGSLHSWNVKTRAALHPSTPPNLSIILRSQSPTQPSATVLETVHRPHATSPVVFLLSTGQAYAFSPTLSAFLLLGTTFHARGSAHWELTPRRTATHASRGLLLSLEASLLASSSGTSSPPAAPEPAPEGWEDALSLGHLETRLQTCVELGATPQEYKLYLGAYAKRLGEEGYRAKAEELVRELAGPQAVQYPALSSGASRIETEQSSTTILGVPRRDLLKETLSAFVKSKTLVKLGQDWQAELRRIAAVERED